MIGQRLGRFHIREEVGSGGMGVVYRARDDRLERDVALKVLPQGRLGDPAARKRFSQEAKALSQLNHPNVATVHDFDAREGVDFLVMEYIAGRTLGEKLGGGALEEKEVVRLGTQLMEGLAAAHAQGVIHRDLKPGNLRITPEGRVKILDFGLALLSRPVSDTAATESRITQAQAAVGTLPYMAPEQLRGEAADERTDIYAAGAVLYEMATGTRPFRETKGPVLVSAILQQEPAAPSELNPKISQELGGVIVKALAKERKRRYQSAQELVEDLGRVGSGALPVVSAAFPFVEREEELTEPETPVFVARGEELETLGKSLDTAMDGHGRVVFVTGEAGTGKTALASEFVRRSQEEHGELVVAGGNCNAHTGIGDPYLPFREVLGQLSGDVEARWRAGAISREHAARLWDCLPLCVESMVENGPKLIGTFLPGATLVSRAQSYVRSGSDWLGELEQLVERQAAMPAASGLPQSVLFEQYARVLESVARRKPLVLVLDDLQWADAGSIGLLLHLTQRIERSRLLVIGMYRSAEVALGRDGQRHPLESVVNECKQRFGDIEVELGEAGTLEFVSALVDTQPNRLGNGFREALYRQTKGHSLFTIELLRRMQEQRALIHNEEARWVETEALDWETMPARVEAMIGERIERLPEGLREMLRVASVEGEGFTAEVVARVQEADERETVRLLSSELDKRHHLVRAQGIRRVGGQRLSQYRFRHILFQKYLYNRLDEVERSYLHEDVGNVLETLYQEQLGEIAVQLARQFGEAGVTEKAIEYLQQAGATAVQLSANEEAISHFRKGLDLLEALPDTPERDEQELALQLGMAAALTATRGYAAPEVLTACVRARELCELTGEAPYLSRAFWFLISVHGVRAEFDTALTLAKEAMRSAELSRDPLSIAIAHWHPGWLHILVGEFSKAREHLEHVIAFYDPEQHGSLGFAYTLDPGVVCLVWSAYASWFLGYPDDALSRVRKGLALARELHQPHSLAMALLFGGEVHHLLRDGKAYRNCIEEVMRVSMESGLVLYRVWGRMRQGFIATKTGQVEEGIAMMREGLPVLGSMGTRCGLSSSLAKLVEAHWQLREVDEGLKAVSEAESYMETSGEGWYKAEIYRLKGELLLMKGGAEAEAETCFHRAIEVARRQRAKSWELRAMTSLAHLWQRQGKRKEARERLAEVYGWFTEGFDTPDLTEASALLTELSQSRG